MQKIVILSCFFSLCLIGQEDIVDKNAAFQKAQDQFLECLSSRGHNNYGTCKAEYDSLINSMFHAEESKTCDQSENIKKEKKHPQGCLLFFKQIPFLNQNSFFNYLLCAPK